VGTPTGVFCPDTQKKSLTTKKKTPKLGKEKKRFHTKETSEKKRGGKQKPGKGVACQEKTGIEKKGARGLA